MFKYCRLAFAVGVIAAIFATTAAQARQTPTYVIDCAANPDATQTISNATTNHRFYGFKITTTSSIGLDVTMTATTQAYFRFGTDTILTADANTVSTHLNEIYTVKIASFETLSNGSITLACSANEPDEPISEMQSNSPFEQTNLVSSSAAFHALFDALGPQTSEAPEPLAFSPEQARATKALNAINGSFALLGYGSNGTLAGDALLLIGDRWTLKGIIRASIAETDVSGGKLTELDARTSLMLQGGLPHNQRYAIALTGGLGHATAPGQSADSRRLVVDGAYAVPLADALDLIVGANWGVATHDINLGTATGNYVDQMVSGSVAIRGTQSFGQLTLTPSLTGNLGYGVAPDYTDSAAINHAGGTSFLASLDAGMTVAYDFLYKDASTLSKLTPFAGLTLSAFHQSYAKNAGATTNKDGVGTQVELGATASFRDGARARLSGTLGRHGDTISASVTGSLSSSF